MSYIIYGANPWLLPCVMLVVLALTIELPFRFCQRLLTTAAKQIDAFSAVQAGLLTLASFVLGLSFAQASSRYDARRELVVKEANAIGTTWLRADQLGPTQSARFRRVLTAYLAARLDAYQTPHDPALYKRTLDQSTDEQNELWRMASSALQADPHNLGLSLLMQTLNDTIDVSAEQLQALTTHVPTAVVTLTLVLVTLGALSLGLRFAVDRARPAALSAVYIIASVVVISMMIDYDRPQTGFVTVNLNPLKIQLQSMEQSH
ncbi:MAG: hypothetical protein JO113_03025 [Candidatus Eremiobacteraeota bacterium]|nr:hypothetical protein [Candidatus Eremiobacteraeota bacterium]